MMSKRVFLKIDCEGGEYAGLKYFPMELLDNVDQLVMELHFGTIYPE